MPKSRSEYAEQGSFFPCVKNMESYPGNILIILMIIDFM